MNIHGVITHYLRKIRSKVCHAHRVNLRVNRCGRKNHVIVITTGWCLCEDRRKQPFSGLAVASLFRGMGF